jgi:hypothetical protein
MRTIGPGAANGVRAARHERGQVLVLFVVLISMFFVAAAISIDYGLWLSERRGVARAADMAALAAAQDLPADVSSPAFDTEASCGGLAACEAAFDWAERNSYGEGTGATVKVTFFCGNQLTSPPSGVCVNENANTPPYFMSPCQAEVGCDAINVTVKKPAVSLFSTFFGGVSFDVGYSSWGNVSFRIVPLGTALMVDATGSMDVGCNAAQNNSGCPIGQARIAAKNFTDILLDNGSPLSQVGYAPYRGCYSPPRSGAGSSGCVPAMTLSAGNCNAPPPSSWVLCLGTDATRIHTRIDNTNTPSSGTGTNVCLALYEARAILNGPGAATDPDARQFAVILTDGDNTYNNDSFGQGAPPVECSPSDPANSDGNLTGNCSNAQTRERQLDMATRTLATTMKDAGVEIYVIAFGVCGTNNTSQFPTSSYCGAIGNGSNDDTADRRLLKCTASSTEDTNDHYFEVNSAAELGDIFQVVAYEIAGRGLTVGPPP